MPLQFTCPHCGKQTTVDEQYAGRSGPCQACGKTITIPLGAPLADPGGGSGVGAVLGVLAVAGVVLLLVCGGGLAATLLVARSSVQGTATGMQATNHLKQLGIALHNYHDVHGAFPPAVVRDAEGKPLYSGRVLLLPYLERQTLYDAWDKSAAWDSPSNRALSQQPLPVFRQTQNAAQPGCDFLFFTGPGTVFEETGQPLRFHDVTDGLSNTIYIAESNGAGLQSWAEPKDFVEGGPLEPGGADNNRVLVGYCDGSVRTLRLTELQVLRKPLTTRAGGEALPPVGN